MNISLLLEVFYLRKKKSKYFKRFISYLGIPIADIKFECAPIYSYMVYHSMYEIPWTVENLVDKDFAAMSAVGRLWLELGRNLADSIVSFETIETKIETIRDIIF